METLPPKFQSSYLKWPILRLPLTNQRRETGIRKSESVSSLVKVLPGISGAELAHPRASLLHWYRAQGPSCWYPFLRKPFPRLRENHGGGRQCLPQALYIIPSRHMEVGVSRKAAHFLGPLYH